MLFKLYTCGCSYFLVVHWSVRVAARDSHTWALGAFDQSHLLLAFATSSYISIDQVYVREVSSVLVPTSSVSAEFAIVVFFSIYEPEETPNLKEMLW